MNELFVKFKADLIRIKREIMEYIDSLRIIFSYLNFFNLRIQNDALNGQINTNKFEQDLNELRDYIKRYAFNSYSHNF